MRRLFLLLFIALNSAFATPPAGYNLTFNGNFHGKGGNGDGWLPISENGPLPIYKLGGELWSPEFIAHTPDGRDFGYSRFTSTMATQAYGKMTWTPKDLGSPAQWTGILCSTVDHQTNGYSVKPPFYATVHMSFPTGRDVWPSFWMTTVNRILPRPQTTNSAEIDVIEMYGSAPYTDEIHTAARDKNGNQISGSAGFIANPGALSQYGEFYSVWVNTDLVRFYVESSTWDGKPAGDYRQIFSCPFLPDMNQPWYLMIDYAMQDRSWTGQAYTKPTAMSVWSFQCFAPPK